jgi:hypothetical protein
MDHFAGLTFHVSLSPLHLAWQGKTQNLPDSRPGKCLRSLQKLTALAQRDLANSRAVQRWRPEKVHIVATGELKIADFGRSARDDLTEDGTLDCPR